MITKDAEYIAATSAVDSKSASAANDKVHRWLIHGKSDSKAKGGSQKKRETDELTAKVSYKLQYNGS